MIGLNIIDEVLKVEETITSNYFSLKELLKLNNGVHLQIPLYQRLYVWKTEEIKLFLEDISEAFIDKQASYFIGNMMFANNKKEESIVIDIIDGQQRFTTLWLISIILAKQNVDLKDFAFVNNEPRLSFTSRDSVNEFFKQLCENDIDVVKNENIQYGVHFRSSLYTNEIEPIITGITDIYNTLKQIIIKNEWDNVSLADFGDYILDNLLMVQTTVPSRNNLNQIFESLNSGGKQLENHQILKARFLKVLRDSAISKEVIDVLAYKWEASSKMNLYLERSIYSITSEKWSNVLHCQVRKKGFESNQSKDYFRLDNYITNTIEHPINLLSILESNPKIEIKEKNKQTEHSRSIISFSQFILHTLRVYNLVYNITDPIPIDSKNLLTFFDLNEGEFASAEKIENFINLLFELRFLYDKYVIRWVIEEDSQESLFLTKSSYDYYETNKTFSVQRQFRESNRELSLAQSVLHIVQESKTQYWISPFLFYLYDRYTRQNVMESYDMSISAATLFIEKLDNYFYCQENESQKMSKLSFKNFKSVFENGINGDYNYVSVKMNEFKGTFFFRYWFYKTEYLIWKYRNDIKPRIKILDSEIEQWEKYKITFKTSIEHIFPQSKDGFESDSDQTLDSENEKRILKDYFGNLVLLTVSENSEYGAMGVDDKKTKFKLKLRENSIDSLKSSLVFKLVDQESNEHEWESGVWSFSKAKYHVEEQILPLYKKHLK